MKRMIRMVGVLTLVAGLAGLIQPVGAEADGTLTNKQIMVKLNKGDKSLCPMLGKELKEATPQWAEIQKQSKEFAELAAAMAKNKASKGPAASWEKLTKEYATDAKCWRLPPRRRRSRPPWPPMPSWSNHARRAIRNIDRRKNNCHWSLVPCPLSLVDDKGQGTRNKLCWTVRRLSPL